MTFQTVHTPPGSPRLPTQTAAPMASVEQPSASLRESVTALKRYYQPHYVLGGLEEEKTEAHFLSELERRIVKDEEPTDISLLASAALGEGVTALKQYYQLEEETDAPFLSELERRILKGEKPTDISLLDRACALGDWKRAMSLLPEVGLDRWIPKIDASFKEACEIGDLNTARTLIGIVAESPATGQILGEWDEFVSFHHYGELREPISSALCILYGWPSSSAK